MKRPGNRLSARNRPTAKASLQAIWEAHETKAQGKSRFQVRTKPKPQEWPANGVSAVRWYGREVKRLFGLFPTISANDALVYRNHIKPIWGLKTGERPTRQQWDEFYRVMTYMLEHWSDYLSSRSGKAISDPPRYPPLPWAKSWWEGWHSFMSGHQKKTHTINYKDPDLRSFK